MSASSFVNRSAMAQRTELEKELCDYLFVRHVDIAEIENPEPPNQVPSKIIRHWKKQWVVLKCEPSPSYCFVGHCRAERDWLLSGEQVPRAYLGDFKVSRMATKSRENVLLLKFASYSLQLAFNSLTKMDQWHTTIQDILARHHVDLVRSPEHPKLEGEYVAQCSSEVFRFWSLKEDCSLAWEWHLKHLRRMQFHRDVDKLEVEAGRSAATGEGHFYFTGPHVIRLFEMLKEMMTRPRTIRSDSQSSGPPSTPPYTRSTIPRSLPRDNGSPSQQQHTLPRAAPALNGDLHRRSLPPPVPRPSESDEDNSYSSTENSSPWPQPQPVMTFAPPRPSTPPPPVPPREPIQVTQLSQSVPTEAAYSRPAAYMSLCSDTRVPDGDYVTVTHSRFHVLPSQTKVIIASSHYDVPRSPPVRATHKFPSTANRLYSPAEYNALTNFPYTGLPPAVGQTSSHRNSLPPAR